MIATLHLKARTLYVRAFALYGWRSDIGSPRSGFFVAFGEVQVVAVCANGAEALRLGPASSAPSVQRSWLRSAAHGAEAPACRCPGIAWDSRAFPRLWRKPCRCT